MSFNAFWVTVSLFLASAAAECNTGQPAGVDLCSKIPIIGKGGWPVNWPLPLLKNISAKAGDGTAIRIDDIGITKVWIADCSLTGTKENLTVAAQSTGMKLRARSLSSGTPVEASVELGNCFAQALVCKKPPPTHSGKIHGKAHIEGDSLATAMQVGALPNVVWSPVSEEDNTLPMEVSTPDSPPDMFFHLMHPVIEALLNMGRSSSETFDWCSALAPIMHKSVQCTDTKICYLEDATNKVMGWLNLGHLPYELPKLFDVVVASGKAYADNPRITQIVSPTCSAKTSLPLAADVSASGIQVVLQVDIRVHICTLWVICHDLHPTTFATLTFPGTFAATVTQPEGLLSLRVSQSITEFDVDAHWDEFLLAATPGNSTQGALESCAKTLTKENATACDELAVEAAHQSLALELGHGNLGRGLRSTINDFVGMRIDGSPPPDVKVSFSTSNKDTLEIVV